MASGDKLPLAYVIRPPDPDSLLAFDTFRGGADLKVADATMGPHGDGHRGRQRAQRAGRLCGPASRDRRRARPRVELRRHEADLRRARLRARWVWICSWSTGGGGRLHPVDHRCRSHPGPRPRAQLRPHVRPERRDRVRLDALRDADAEDVPAQLGSVPHRAERRLHGHRTDDVPAELRALPRDDAGRTAVVHRREGLPRVLSAVGQRA